MINYLFSKRRNVSGEDDYTRAPLYKKFLANVIAVVSGVLMFCIAMVVLPFILPILAFLLAVVVLCIVYAISIELFIHGNEKRREYMFTEYW